MPEPRAGSNSKARVNPNLKTQDFDSYKYIVVLKRTYFRGQFYLADWWIVGTIQAAGVFQEQVLNNEFVVSYTK